MTLGRVTNLIFIIFGALTVVGSIYLFINTFLFMNNALKAEGTVVDLIQQGPINKKVIFPVIKYMTQSGSETSTKSNVASSAGKALLKNNVYKIGENVQILYDPKNFNNLKINNFSSLWLGPIALFLFGMLFFLIGIFSFLRSNNLTKNKAWLTRHGTKISTELIGIEPQDMGNGVSGGKRIILQSRIFSKWANPNDNKTYYFSSERANFDLTPYVQSKTINVLIDPNNPKKYYVDISQFEEQFRLHPDLVNNNQIIKN